MGDIDLVVALASDGARQIAAVDGEEEQREPVVVDLVRLAYVDLTDTSAGVHYASWLRQVVLRRRKHWDELEMEIAVTFVEWASVWVYLGAPHTGRNFALALVLVA